MQGSDYELVILAGTVLAFALVAFGVTTVVLRRPRVGAVLAIAGIAWLAPNIIYTFGWYQMNPAGLVLPVIATAVCGYAVLMAARHAPDASAVEAGPADTAARFQSEPADEHLADDGQPAQDAAPARSQIESLDDETASMRSEAAALHDENAPARSGEAALLDAAPARAEAAPREGEAAGPSDDEPAPARFEVLPEPQADEPGSPAPRRASRAAQPETEQEG